MKKALKFLLVFILVLGFAGCGSTKAKEGEKVKVYIFYAGGCPYCEAQVEYLKSLEGYDKTFEIVEKELYVDHVDWATGKDFELGVKVAEAFQEAGFEDASYQGTPFVVISDTYAMAAYNPDLEGEIKKAYDEGDKDIVGCFEKGDNCEIREYLTETDKKINEIKSNNLTNFIIIYVLLGGIIAYLALKAMKNDKRREIPKKETRIEVVEEKPKKKPTKKKK